MASSDPVSAMSHGDASPKGLVCSMCWQELFSTPDFQQLCKAPFKDGKNGNAAEVECRYTTSMSRIYTSATGGCEWCTFMTECLKLNSEFTNKEVANDPLRVIVGGHNISEHKLPDGEGILQCLCTPPGNNQFRLRLLGAGQRFANIWFNLFYHDLTDPRVTVTAADVQSQLHHPPVWDEARQWLKDCAQHDCCPRQGPKPLPSRVIDVGADPTGLTVSLVSGEDRADFYAALSYCWGDSQCGLTTSQNLKQRWTSIDTQLLSSSVRDAIWVTKQLGLSYLWVDAICIMQDSLEDKVHELKAMAAIYQQAHLTIIAASSKSASHGFLDDRQTPMFPKHTFPFWTKDKRLTCIRGRRGEINESADPGMEPLERRAWAFQENILSSRRLLFNERAMQYECRQHRVSLRRSHSKIPAHQPVRVFASPESIMVLPGHTEMAKTLVSSRKTRHHFTSLSGIAIRQTWQAILKEYTGRSLKFRDDVFSALAAIAEEFQPHVGQIYLAGLWDGPMLPALLLWMARLSHQPEAGWEVEDLAPSWSWASVGYSINYWPKLRDKPITWQAQLNCVRVQPRYESLPYGPVNFGYMRLRAKIRRAHYERSSYSHAMSWYPPGPRGSKRSEWSWVLQSSASIDPRYREQDRDVLCLALCRTDADRGEDTRIHGLIVVETEQQGIYRRVGMFCDKDPGEFDECETLTLVLV